jgi:uncharacterized cupin superfamily protein
VAAEVINVLGDEWDEPSRSRPPGFEWRSLGVGRALGGELLGATLYELPAGQRTFPYHWHAANEELLLVLDGRPTLRTPEGERELERGDLVVFRRSPDGLHQVRNDADEPARLMMLSTKNAPEIVEYPDSGKLSAMAYSESHRGGPLATWHRFDNEVDFFDGEAPRA